MWDSCSSCWNTQSFNTLKSSLTSMGYLIYHVILFLSFWNTYSSHLKTLDPFWLSGINHNVEKLLVGNLPSSLLNHPSLSYVIRTYYFFPMRISAYLRICANICCFSAPAWPSLVLIILESLSILLECLSVLILRNQPQRWRAARRNPHSAPAEKAESRSGENYIK